MEETFQASYLWTVGEMSANVFEAERRDFVEN